jgi:hypothetical protein
MKPNAKGSALLERPRRPAGSIAQAADNPGWIGISR